jgi:hypothetical protein
MPEMPITLESFTVFEQELLVAAYYASNILEKQTVTLEEIGKLFRFDFDRRWVVNALSDYWANGLSKEQLFHGAVEAQRIWLTGDGLRRAEYLIGSGIRPSRLDAAAAAPSSGQSILTEEQREAVLREVLVAERQILAADLSNLERSQAQAFVAAIRALAEAPEPPKDLIWEIISRANSLAGIAGLFVAIAALFA